MKRRLLTILLCAATALLVWLLIPGSSIDRAIFKLTTLTFAENPYFTTGTGAKTNPHTLRNLSHAHETTPKQLPTIVSLGDDPDGFFQSSPPSPIDFAVILRNIKRLGQDNPAIAIPLAWQEADIISLTALDQQLDKFSAPVTCAPLTRNPVPSPIPPAFRRGSIPLSEVEGNIALLPIVNRVSIPDIVLGNKTSLAGFTALESESTDDIPHLLARWEDRVVLSFQFLVILNHFELQPSDIKIHLGEYIEVGKEKSYIPIDEFGRLSFTPPALSEDKNIPAPNLIDAPDNLFEGTNFRPVVLRNDLSSTDASFSAFSKSLVGTIAALSDPDFTSPSTVFQRYSPAVELLALSSLLCLVFGFGNYPALGGRFPLIILAGLILLFHFALLPIVGAWLPTLPAIVLIATAIPFTRKMRSTAPSQVIACADEKVSNQDPKPDIRETKKPDPVAAPSKPEQGGEKEHPAVPKTPEPAKLSELKQPTAKKAAKATVRKAVKKSSSKSSRKRSNRKPRK